MKKPSQKPIDARLRRIRIVDTAGLRSATGSNSTEELHGTGRRETLAASGRAETLRTTGTAATPPTCQGMTRARK